MTAVSVDLVEAEIGERVGQAQRKPQTTDLVLDGSDVALAPPIHVSGEITHVARGQVGGASCPVGRHLVSVQHVDNLLTGLNEK